MPTQKPDILPQEKPAHHQWRGALLPQLENSACKGRPSAARYKKNKQTFKNGPCSRRIIEIRTQTKWPYEWIDGTFVPLRNHLTDL